jgi:ABC-2 type transport system ATP-binding protein
MLEVSKVQKTYGDHRALRNLSFSAVDGRIVGFLGPNGAGKTTAMNILSGFMEPTSGTVRVCGMDLAKERKKALEVTGYLPENPPLYPEMTVIEYLRFTAALKGLKGRRGEEEAIRLMKLLQTEGEASKLIGRLSKGTKQRVAIAGALVGSPKVLLLDEPSNGLDPGQTAAFKKVLKDLKKSGSTIIVSSHILSQISDLCDEMLIINRGRLIASGTAEFFEKKLSRDGGLVVDIPAPEAECRKVLENIAHICSTRYEGRTASGASEFTISGYRTDIRKELFSAIAESGLYIERLVPAGKTLEEIYLGMIEASEAEFEKARKRAEQKRTEQEKKGEDDEDDLF